jgi:hypothetical protein
MFILRVHFSEINGNTCLSLGPEKLEKWNFRVNESDFEGIDLTGS